MALYLFLFLTGVFATEGARILAVFPVPSISHQVVFRPLTQELARQGHELVIVTPDPAFPKGEAPANITEIDVHDISYKIWRDNILSTTTGKNNDIFTQFDTILYHITDIFEAQMQTKEVQKLLNNKNEKFDLLLLEACVRSAISLSHVYKVPVILVSSFGAIPDNYDVVGAPSHPLLYPSFHRQILTNLSLWDKAVELYNHFHIQYIFYKHGNRDDLAAKRLFGEHTPSVTELANNVDMLFLNMHPLWEGNRPVPPSVVYMGGLHQKPVKELPTDLKSYLDSSKHGVIYISFGTNVSPSLLPPERIQVLVRVFSRLRYDVLWKWDKDELPNRSENIRISKWLPQSDLLRHPKIKLFITQGGLQSTDEALTAGVPLIGMPMLGDQWYNVEKYVEHKIGLRVDLENLTEDVFEKAIDTILKDDSYRRNVVRLRALMSDAPAPPLQRAAWWVQHVLRHGGAAHLRAPAANMPWRRYLELDLLAAALAALAATLAAVAAALLAVYRLLRRLLTSVKVKVA